MTHLAMARGPATGNRVAGGDRRLSHRAVLKEWFAGNANRIHIKTTREGEEYAKAMTNWELAGSKPELKPSWSGRGGHEFDIDLMGTESFITWMRDRFRMPNAENAWAAIRIAAGNNVPDTRDGDPVYLRK